MGFNGLKQFSIIGIRNKIKTVIAVTEFKFDVNSFIDRSINGKFCSEQNIKVSSTTKVVVLKLTLKGFIVSVLMREDE
jgi:hypothetical protein